MWVEVASGRLAAISGVSHGVNVKPVEALAQTLQSVGGDLHWGFGAVLLEVDFSGHTLVRGQYGHGLLHVDIREDPAAKQFLLRDVILGDLAQDCGRQSLQGVGTVESDLLVQPFKGHNLIILGNLQDKFGRRQRLQKENKRNIERQLIASSSFPGTHFFIDRNLAAGLPAAHFVETQRILSSGQTPDVAFDDCWVPLANLGQNHRAVVSEACSGHTT